MTSYYLSTDTVFNASVDKFIGSYYAYNIDSQHFISYSNSIYTPNVTNGNYYIIVVLNTNNEVAETNTANNSKYIPVTVGVVTDIDSHNLLSASSLYPNPSTGIVYIENLSQEEASVEVYNTSNQLMFEEAKVVGHFTLEHLPEGLYLVKIKRENLIVQSQKIVIVK